jgi:divalent metal cation (Fe/Co/Zn/Cd) transporter
VTTPLRRAIRLSELTIAWNTVVGGAAVATAIVTSSLSLIGFGINALVDSSVSVILIIRFRHEEAGREEHAERGEALALRVAAFAFLAIAIYLIVQSLRSLFTDHHAGHSIFGVVEAIASLIVLPILGIRKYQVAGELGSRALRADSMLTFFGAALAAVACISLVLAWVLGWWWSDDVGALVIAGLLLSESVRSFREE